MPLQTKKPAVLFRLVLCILVLALGAGSFVVLKKMKKAPAEKKQVERPLPVQTVTVHSQDFPISIQGFGDVVSRTTVTLSAEVNGRITFRRDHLQVGRNVNKGEILFKINQEDSQLDLATAEALLKILQRDRALAQTEFKRLSALYRDNKVGSQSGVDKAESTLNNIANQLRQVRKNKERAAIQLSRCLIRAPFNGRIAAVSIDKNEYVKPGQQLITLVNDADLEVIVPLDSRDASRWLKLREKKELGDAKEKELKGNWFPHPEAVPCTVVWSENPNIKSSGILDRVVRFEAKTRMLSVAVVLERHEHTPFPLNEGMFCRVTIPGRTLHQVYVIPREAVHLSSMVSVVKEHRLQNRKVTVVREEKGLAVISKGLSPGDVVITTRLENPLDNSLVRIVGQDGK